MMYIFDILKNLNLPMVSLAYMRKYIIMILITFVFIISRKIYCESIHIHNIGVNNVASPTPIISNVGKHTQYINKKHDDKYNENLKERLKALDKFALNLDMKYMYYSNYGFLRVFIDNSLQKDSTKRGHIDKDIYLKKILIKDKFIKKNIVCLNLIETLPENYKTLLGFILYNSEKYPCINKKISSIQYHILRPTNSKCWNNCEIYLYDMIFQYLRSICRASSKIQSGKGSTYYLCCMDFITSYMLDLDIRDISIDGILNFSEVKSCRNREKYTQINLLVNVISFGFPCTGFPELLLECYTYKECKYKVEIKVKHEKKIEPTLDIVENMCKLPNKDKFIDADHFFNWNTIIGFICSVLASILLFYFRL